MSDRIPATDQVVRGTALGIRMNPGQVRDMVENGELDLEEVAARIRANPKWEKNVGLTAGEIRRRLQKRGFRIGSPPAPRSLPVNPTTLLLIAAVIAAAVVLWRSA